ncbi:DUF4198 domain-containing protein [Tenacibaculum geojense]|uniref:DUF4198 domain-containing protein n=1 Tax=Tenacibaculum geojense TaxID=915352 RepID=A0ABW3JU85_9FLAO
MKKNVLIILLTLLISNKMTAHYLWIETNNNGKLNEKQTIKVHYGEYTYGVIEKVNEDAFKKVKNFTLWIIDPSGNKQKLTTKALENYYEASYIPKLKGNYTVFLNNNKIDVIDYTQYDFGIFKTHYHSTANFNVGGVDNENKTFNENGIVVKRISSSSDKIKLQVLYKNKPLVGNELKIFVSDLWSKTLETDKDGMVLFSLPWKTKYIIETTKKEEVPGNYNGKDYQFIWHCATYSIIHNK